MLNPTKRAKPETLYGLTYSLWWELICKHRLHLEDWVHLTRTSPFFAFLQEEITKRANYVFCNLPREHWNKPLVEVYFPHVFGQDPPCEFFSKHPHAFVMMYERTVFWDREICEDQFYGVYSSKERLCTEFNKRMRHTKNAFEHTFYVNYTYITWATGKSYDHVIRVSKAIREQELKTLLTC